MDQQTRTVTRRRIIAAVLAFAFVALLVLAAKGCEAMAGGPVHSTSEFQKYVATVTRTGERTYDSLSPAPLKAPWADKGGSTSCVDDLGVDSDGVTRDQPMFGWSLEFRSAADYRTAVAHLKSTWQHEGHTVTTTPAAPPANPARA